MSYFVTVLALNGRRYKIPVKLNTPILMVLEETCKKYKLNPNEYELKYHNRILDLASNIQFSGITNNAELELAPASKQRAETPVDIFLQLESGERLSGSFLPSYTLWDIISALCSEEMKLKQNPVIIYTRQEVYGDKLKSTTLKMFGLTGGKALLRLIHRTENQLKNQSVSTIYKLQAKPKPVEEKLPSSSPSPTRSSEPEKLPPSDQSIQNSPSNEYSTIKSNSDSGNSSSNEDSTAKCNPDLGSPMQIESSNKEVPSKPSRMDVENETATPEAVLATPQCSKSIADESSSDRVSEVKTPQSAKSEFNIDDVEFIGERYALIFHVDSMPSPRFRMSEDDDFYELTVEDAKTLLRDIKRTRSELEEADLETSEARARRRSMLLERTLSIYPYCVVRIIFPNRYVLQGVFQSTDSVADVITFTKTFVDEFILSFYLYISPPKRILKAKETLLDIGAIPGVNLYFGLDQTNLKNRFLKSEYLSKAVAPNVALEVANYFRRAGGMKTKPLFTTPKPSSSVDIVPQPRVEPAEIENVIKKPASGKVPKWFKPL